MLPEPKKYTYEEFLQITRNVDRAELIDGEIFFLASPSPEHQRITGRLYASLLKHFDGKACEAFIAPLDVILENDEFEEKNSVQPDVMVICDKSGINKINYTGVPTIVIEVLSPSTTATDTIKKMYLYMKYGVPEYWIVSPKNKTISVYFYDKEMKAYTEPNIYSKEDIVKSKIFSEISIELMEIFK